MPLTKKKPIQTSKKKTTSKRARRGTVRRAERPSILDRDYKLLSLRPGILVSLSVRAKGGVYYATKELGTDKRGQTEIREWETTRTIDDVAEYQRAVQLRNACRNTIIGACICTPFGYLCIDDRAGDLQTAIDKAEAMAAEHNATARHCSVSVYVMRGRIEQTDTQAMRAIGGELKELVSQMRTGIAQADVKMIRQAAAQARSMSKMLGDESQAKRVTDAVSKAREAASTIVKELGKEGATADAVISKLGVEALDENRFAFLDVDDDVEVGTVPAIDASRFDVDGE